MLRLTKVACRRDGHVLFQNADGMFNRPQKVGVTGRNGCGKSSLFSLVLGNLEADEGRLDLQPGITIAHVAQETVRTDQSAIEYVMDGDRRMREVQLQVKQLEAAITADAAQETDQKQATLLAEALEKFAGIGGYSAESRAGSLLNGLGFSAEQHHHATREFSGGWMMRLNLAQALMCPSDLLLLDEPTNHLDLDAVFWLQGWLRRYDGTLLMISHDREFLDAVVDSILHIEHETVTRYTGNYSDFEQLRASRLANQQALFERQQKKTDELQRFIDRFRAKATKARQAQSRVKMLERMQKVAPAHVDSGFGFTFKEPLRMSDPLVTLTHANVGYDDDTILRNVDFQLGAGDRVALLGRNGAGKSTLVKALVGELALQSGDRTAGVNLSTGYFAQHQIDQLDYSGTVLDQLQKLDAELGEAETRNILGGFGFSGDMALQAVNTLSGGEKARLVLAMLVHARPNLLLLDEPTNHLDMDMRLALSEALQTFAGALVVVSHDRFVLESVADELWLIADSKVTRYDDDLDGYRRWLSQQQSNKHAIVKEQLPRSSGSGSGSSPRATASAGVEAVNRKDAKRNAAQKRQELAPLRKRVTQAEQTLELLQQELAELQQQLADNELYTTERKGELTELLKHQKTLRLKLQETETLWLDASEELDQASS